MKKKKTRCGDIYWLEFNGATGHQFYKKRPYLVVDSDEYINISNMVCVVPLTSKAGNTNIYDVVVAKNSNNNLTFDSVVKLDHIYTYNKYQFINYSGFVDRSAMSQIHSNLRKHFNL